MTNEELKTLLEQEIAKCQANKEVLLDLTPRERFQPAISYWNGRIHSYEEAQNMLEGTFE